LPDRAACCCRSATRVPKDPHQRRYRRCVTRALQQFRQLHVIVMTLAGQNWPTSSCDDDAFDERRQAVWFDAFRLGGIVSWHDRVWIADVVVLIRGDFERSRSESGFHFLVCVGALEGAA
jgi:hypothetical protein